MQDLYSLINEIPIRSNMISHIVLLGIVQGFFLGAVILFRSRSKNRTLKIFAWLLIIQSIVILDNHLCYTGLMKYVLHLNDSTEPLVLVMFPLLYLFLFQLIERKPFVFKKQWIHFLPAILYALTQVQYYLQPLSVKYNAYLGAYHSHLNKVQIPEGITYEYHWVKDEFRWFVLLSCLFYIILSIRLLVQKKNQIIPTKRKGSNKYSFMRNAVLIMIISLILVFLVFVNYEDDGGDHLIGIFNAVITFSTSFVIVSESRFFENSWIADKYETLGHKETTLNLSSIDTYIIENSFFLEESASLKNLATLLDTTTNHVSKVINVEANMNFNEYINSFRVNCAKGRLIDSNYSHLTIEAIGNSVGFKSKTAFYNAFKKQVNQSPKQFVTHFKQSDN